MERKPDNASYFRLESIWQNILDNLLSMQGFDDLTCLLSRQNEKVHCSELMGAAFSFQDGEEILDARAKEEYKNRLIELQEELAA